MVTGCGKAIGGPRLTLCTGNGGSMRITRVLPPIAPQKGYPLPDRLRLLHPTCLLPDVNEPLTGRGPRLPQIRGELDGWYQIPRLHRGLQTTFRLGRAAERLVRPATLVEGIAQQQAMARLTRELMDQRAGQFL